jgi:hypothetical protein
MSTSRNILSNSFISRLSQYVDKDTDIITVCFDVKGQLQIWLSVFMKYLEKLD